MKLEKPKGIEIKVWDRKANKSKSLTVYDTTVEEVCEKLKRELGTERSG